MKEEMKDMTLAEGLKTVKLNLKKISKLEQEINKYASKLSNEMSPFGDEKEHKKKVAALVQKGEDLIRNTLKLKSAIEKTNAVTEVSVGGETFTITELLFMKRKSRFNGSMLYEALSVSNAEARLGFMNNPDAKITAVQMYKEEDRNNGLRKWEEIREFIEVKLETLNNVTKIIF